MSKKIKKLAKISKSKTIITKANKNYNSFETQNFPNAMKMLKRNTKTAEKLTTRQKDTRSKLNLKHHF